MHKKLNILLTNEAPLIIYGIKSGFDNLGHNTFVMSGENRLWGKSKEIQIEIFKNYIDNNHIDLIFSECFSDFSEEIFKYSKLKNIPHFFWSIEDTPNVHWIGDYWSKFADHVFTTTAECLMNYWNNGIGADLLPFGVNKDYHKPYSSYSQYTNDIVLVGQNYDRREDKSIQYYYPIIKQGYDFKIYGNDMWIDEKRKCNLNWTIETYKGMIAYEDLGKLYASSKVILGAQCDDQSYTQLSMRNFEVLGWAGNSAIMISPYSKAQEFLFGEHIYLPKTPKQMIDMIDEVLSMSDKQRIKKAKEAQNFVYKYHNYDIRAKKVLDVYYEKYGS